jgi:hypothetical protein
MFIDIAALVFVMFLLSKLVFPRLYMPIGRAPAEIAIPAFLGNESASAQRSMLAMVLNEIDAAQAKIEYNERQNAERTRRLKFSMYSILVLFVFSAITLVFYVS